jgi:hypothetical protein
MQEQTRHFLPVNLDRPHPFGYAGRMTGDPQKTKAGTAPPARKGQTREDRLKSALKANMARRKAQARSRATSGPVDDDAPENETE